VSPICTRTLAAAAFAALAAAPATRAEVVEVSETGFTVKEAVTVSVPPEKAYAYFVAIGKWWDSAHTYSGDAANLSIDARPQGCYCEKLADGGGVRHLTVVFVSPGKRLSLVGGLGPLQSMGVTGSMTITFAPAEKGTAVTLRYVVGGHNAGGFQEISAGVDAVLRAQFERYRAYAEPVKP
jgi:uncharacterized protein YndB with AHSA1/START domain